MSDKNIELIEQELDLLFPQIQKLLFQISYKGLDNITNEIETEVKKCFEKINSISELSDNLPYRGSEKYLKIEKYEDYEFTHCIAYEMAIRNKEVIKLNSLMEEINSLIHDIYRFISNKELKKIIDTKNDYIDLTSLLNLKSKLFMTLEKNLNESEINFIIKSFNSITKRYDDTYLLSIINIYNKENIELYLKQNMKSLSSLFNQVTIKDKILIIEILLDSIELKLEKEFYIVNERKSVTPDFINDFIPKDTNHEPNPAINEHISTTFNDSDYMDNYINEKGYTSYQGKYKDDNSFNINKVLPNFEQPLRMFNTMEISINPSLPLNDILSFVKKIKEDYDKKNSFKSFFELIEEELNFPTDTTKSTITNTSSFSKNKWADMFYIYDYFQYYFSDGNEISKDKTENERENKEDDSTTIAKEISLQLSYYHILKYKNSLNFSTLCDDSNYKSPYSKYETDLLFEIKEKIEENKEYEEYIKLKKTKDGDTEETINLYMTANHIKTDYYPKMKKLIEGENPEYKKLIGGRNHEKNSFIDGKNNASSKL